MFLIDRESVVLVNFLERVMSLWLLGLSKAISPQLG